MNQFKRAFCAIALITTAFPLLASQSDEKTLRYLKEVLWPKAYKEQHVELLDKILDPTFELVAAEGLRTSKSEELASLAGFSWPHDNFKFTIKRLDIYHSQFAIVSGEGRANGTNTKGAYCFVYQSSNVLHKVESEWKAVLSHVSGVKSC